MVKNHRCALGTLEFTGLAIVYALYKTFEGAGAVDKDVSSNSGGGGTYAVTQTDADKEESPDVSEKSEKKAVIFKSRPLLSNNKDTVSLDAYKTTN